LELSQADGRPTGVSGSVTIPPNGQVARFLKELIPSAPDEFAGLLRVTATSRIAAVGLRLTVNERADYLMSTIPLSRETTRRTNQDFLFPQVVTGGGFTTEIVVFNPQAGSASANMSFATKDGAPLPVQ